jgi:biopolymer transport protein ExbB/TolQ
VSAPVSFGIALICTLLFYGVSYPVRGSYLGELFWDRGWVPYVLVLLISWSLAILALKLRKVRQQRRAMLLDVLPESIGREITMHNVDRFLDHISKLPENLQDSLIVKRMQLALRHFRIRQSNPEVANMLVAQSEIDAGTIDSSYSLLKVFLWAIPILGFIGTVIGISAAVGGFSGSLEAAQDIAVLKESLNNVTQGLSVAFDTTLVALVMSIIISFPTSAMQKAEQHLLGWVDAYCIENLLKRLDDTRTVSGGDAGNVQEAVLAIAQTLGKTQQSILSEFRSVQEHMSEVQQNENLLLQGMADAFNEQLAAMDERAQSHMEKLDSVIGEVVTPIRESVSELSRNGNAIHERTGELLRESTDSVKTYMSALAEGLAGLNSVLSELGEKQVVVQQTRRKWGLPFGSGRK